MERLKLLKIYLWLLAIFTSIWWPLSHWLFPDWYHNLMGFVSYDYALVKIIGTCGILPSLALVFAALRPTKNKDMIIIIIVFAISMALTHLFLINTQHFPKEEYYNVILLFANAVVLGFLYPWNLAKDKAL